MAFFEDLTPYSYLGNESGTLNVGWLSDEHPYSKGEVDEVLIDKLVHLAANPTNIMRGLHYCPFCTEESPITISSADGLASAVLGTGEIRLTNASGISFAAPTLLIHYIRNHNYLPPREFLMALSD